MKILIIGGTGFISSSMTRKFLDKGYDVTLFNRGNKRNKFNGSERLKFIYGDRDDKKSLEKAAQSSDYDAVYDMIAYTPEQSETAVEIFRGRTGRFIHCSTISVYMISDEVILPVTEDQDKKPVMEYFHRNPFGMQYGIDKRKCEEVLWEKHDRKDFPVTTVRPTFISGPEDPAKRDYFWIQRILDGRPLLVPGTGEYVFQQIYVEDCAEIFCRVIENDVSVGEAYNAAAEEIFTLNDYLKKLAGMLERENDLVHLDQAEFDKLDISYSDKGDVFPFNTRKDAVFSLAKTKQHLGYRSIPFEDWMKKTIDWFVNVYKKPSTGYEHREKEIEIIKKVRK
jgi:nucleoside-diphosphate-sugar epimerase